MSMFGIKQIIHFHDQLLNVFIKDLLNVTVSFKNVGWDSKKLFKAEMYRVRMVLWWWTLITDNNHWKKRSHKQACVQIIHMFVVYVHKQQSWWELDNIVSVGKLKVTIKEHKLTDENISSSEFLTLDVTF